MANRKNELRDDPIGWLLLRYSAPAVLGMSAHALYNLVDSIFVGHGAGTLAFAALAVCFPVQMIILAVAQIVGIGSASIISRSLGSGDQDRADRMAGTSFVTVVLLGILLAAVTLALLTPTVKLFGATDNVVPYARQYLGIIMMGAPLFALYVSTNNVVRSEGNATLAMTSMIIGPVVNVILDPILIFGLDMGIRGAALATVIAHGCGVVFLLQYFWRGKSMLHVTRHNLWPDVTLWPEMFSIGISSFARVVAGSCVAIVINNSVAHYGGDIYLAVMGALNRVMLFMVMPVFGIVQGLQPILGFNYGAGNLKRARESVWKATAAATAITTAAFLLIEASPSLLLRIFSDDPELIRSGTPVLRVAVLSLPFIGFQAIGSSMFQAIGKARPALFLSVLRQTVFLIPLVLLMPLYFGLWGIWFSMPLADLLATVVTAVWVLGEMRRLNAVTLAP